MILKTLEDIKIDNNNIIKNKALNMMLYIKSICKVESLENKSIDYILKLIESDSKVLEDNKTNENRI